MTDLTEQTAIRLKIMREMAQPALKLGTAARPGFSKIGGRPKLPRNLKWPYWRERPLSFVAQLDLAELQAAATRPDFPPEGRLYFFYPPWWSDSKWGQPWGDKPEHAGSAVVFYSLDEPGPIVEPPDEINQPGFFEFEETGIYNERFLSAQPIESWPSPDKFDCLPPEPGGVYSESGLFYPAHDPVFDLYLEHWRSQFGAGDSLRHQLGGFSYPEQDSNQEIGCQMFYHGLDLDCLQDPFSEPRVQELIPGISDWQMLLQLDSDAGDKRYDDQGDYMCWGAEGLICFWIRKQDLANRDFSKVWAMVQCT